MRPSLLELVLHLRFSAPRTKRPLQPRPRLEQRRLTPLAGGHLKLIMRNRWGCVRARGLQPISPPTG
jgi:hypothetical protein